MADYISALNGLQMDQALMDMAERNSEAFAVGERNGVPVVEGDVTFQNNSKYWAEFAADAAEGASVITDPNEDGNLVIEPPTGSESGWAVRYDAAQTLSEGQKAQARKNITAGGTNPNLLDNPFFFVNQRSFTSQDFGSSNGYTVDRWKAYRSSVTVKSDGSLDVKPNSNDYGLAQYIDTGRLVVGETYTASANVGGDIYTWTFVYTTSAEYSPVAANGSKFYRHTANGLCGLWLVGTANTTYNLRSFKLEKGAFSTLANDAPPDYGTELLKCMSDFVRFNVPAWPCNFGVGRATSTTNCVVFIPLPVPLRASPTVSVTGLGDIQLIGNGNAINVTACSYAGRCEGGVILNFTTSGSLVANNVYTPVRSGSNACYIDLSADLL